MTKWEGGYTLDVSLISLNRFTEIIELQPETKVIARFVTNEEVMYNRPASTTKKIGKGNVIKLAFWPAQNSLTQLIHLLTQQDNHYLKNFLPTGAQAVPRTYKGFFIINTLSIPTNVSLKKVLNDRITGIVRKKNFELRPYEIL